MDKENKLVRCFQNNEIKSITAGIPGTEHRHVRTALETNDGIFIFQEATIAAMVRAYIHVKTHPQVRAVRLEGRNVEDGKPGYAKWQLLETSCGEEAENVLIELEHIVPP